MDALTTLDRQYGEIYRQHPFYGSPDFARALRPLLESRAFQRAADPP